MKKRNLGFSHVITTVILTSVMLVIVLTTSFFANSLLNTQIERSQFDQAKNVILTLDEIVKKVTFKPQSSGYVRSSFWTTIPYLEETGETLQILVDQTPVLDIPVNIVKIQGGSRVSVAVPENLTGSESVLLTSVSDSLGRAHVYQSNGAWIALDYSRIRCINSGTSEFFNGTDYEICNFVEITLIKITFGILEFQEKASITATNIGVEANQTKFYNNFTISVEKSDIEEPETICLSDLGGNPDYPTLINFVVVGVETSILGGG